jgi:hypothetical protein
MSKFIQRLATGYGLSINAGEEASRFGVHAVDVDHVFLALVIDEGTAGQVLRRAGITLAAAREAVASRHREDLERLGVQAELPGDGRIRFLEQGGIEWTDRALDLVSRAGGKHRSGDATAVLRDVLGEPSGTVEDVLARLGTTTSSATSTTQPGSASAPWIPRDSWAAPIGSSSPLRRATCGRSSPTRRGCPSGIPRSRA